MRKAMIMTAMLASAAGCSQSSAEPAGPTVSRSYQVGNFNELESSGPYDVVVRTGSGPSVSAVGSQKLLERTVVEVRGNRLVIRPQEGGWFHINWGSNGHAKFQVTVPQLRAAAIAGSGDIHLDRAKGEDFEGKIGGSGKLTVDNVDVRSLQLQIGGSGSIKTAGGRAQTADYAIGGSGGIDAAAVQAQQAKISIAGAGSVRANATGTADVRIMGSGNVNVAGGARCSVSKAGSGSVHCS